MKREHLNKLHELTQKVNEKKELASELLRTAKDRYGDRVIKDVPRPEGKKADIKESILWQEVFHLGLGCEAGKVLQEKHPEVFDAYAQQDKASKELHEFCRLELDLDYTQLTLSDYLRMTEQLFNLLLDERESE